jgi:membrane associated rhomboid family serine protease
MLPIRDENPTVHASLMTVVIIVANAAVWVFVQKLGTQPGLLQSVFELGLIPGEFLGTVKPGTEVMVSRTHVYTSNPGFELHTIFTSMFLHGSWIHIIGNMWFLGVFGDNVEDAMGSFRFAAFYLICGVAAASAQLFADPTSLRPMVGASGAIGGVMGAYALLYPMVRVRLLVFLGFFITTIGVPAFLMLGYWFALQVLAGMYGGQTGVAVWAHAGGFIAGLVLGRLFCNSERLAECRQKRTVR